MAESLRQIKQRIKSVNNTKKITKAMEMVAAAKLKKYQDLLGQTRAYGAQLERMLRQLIGATPDFRHPFFEVREPKNNLVFLIASDSGLCGSYNYNLFQTAERFLREQQIANSFFSIGRQGLGFIKRRRFQIVGDLSVPRPQEIQTTVKTIIERSSSLFIEGKFDRIYLIYTQFFSMGSYKPTVDLLLPLEPPKSTGEKKSEERYILEPSAEVILNQMIPSYLELKVEQAVKEALVSEQVSRMMAMRQATDNATEMIDALTLARNKARQANITKELIEIVSGSKAQKK